ncbi:uncharacterized protein [Amphiura filiformis]|uniref:uncharacterized protein n=1 Tax=Amphiura filiformis TaxID=82378 RepID=UPI003B21E483
MEALADEIAKRCSHQLRMIPLTTPVTPIGSTLPENSPPNFTDPSTSKVYRKLQPVQFCKTIKWDRFKDNWPNLFIDKVKSYAGRDVIFVGSFHSQDVVFEQLSILYTMPRYLVRSFKFILPYFPTSTMERVDTEGQVATAKVLATMLSSIPTTTRGPAQIVIFDIHALQERFYFTDQVIPRLESAIPLLLREILTLPDEMKSKITIAFPDEGATKRFGSMFGDSPIGSPDDGTIKKYPIVTCTKVRDGDKRIVTVKEGNPKGRHVIIVDDLVQTGGTLINCAKALLDQDAASVSAYVTHAVFPQESWKAFTDKSKIDMKYFWITDSIPHATEIANHKPFKLLSLCDAISDALLGYDLVSYN